MARPDGVSAAPLAAPVWRRARLGLALLAVVVLGAILVGTLGRAPGRPLDPTSARPGGAKALARVLAGYGVTVTRTTDLDTALAAGPSAGVVVISPDDYSAAQLRRLSAAPARVVLVAPGTRATRAVSATLSPDPGDSGSDSPGCSLPGAVAAGDVEFPDDAVPYARSGGARGPVSCYGGLVVVAGRLTVLGSAAVLRNDTLAHDGVAALDVNLLSADRSVRQLVWLLPGDDAGGSGPVSIWDLFPGGAYRAFWWFAVLAVLVVLWRARRLGGVVREPLPVVVRSAEVVEGHGRLYARAGARERAAAALRAAALARITARLALPPGSSAEQVSAAVSPVVRRAPAEVFTVLGGGPPADDAALLRLAQDLDALEAAAGGATTRESS